MDKTIIEIPTELLEAAKITPQEAKTQLAIRLYQLHKLNDEQARALAGDPKAIESLVWSNQETGRVDLDDFLSWASHDLKTPLNAILGFTKVVIKGIDGPINDTQNTDLTTVFNGGQRLLTLVNNLVEMARLNNGQITLARKECNIVELIEDATDRWKIQNLSLPLATNITIAEPTFNVDTNHLRNVIINLLTYAAIRVTEGAISLSASDDDQGVNVSIQSTGEKARDKSEMDSAMLSFICASLIKLHGGKADEPQETEDGLLLSFSLPR
jgi:Signal transduction histidine kinase